MKPQRLVAHLGVLPALLLTLAWGPAAMDQQGSADRNAIEKLHQKDVAATLAGDPKALADLFTDDAVLMQPGGPAVVGKKAILEENERKKAQHPESRSLTYKPDIRDLQILNGWAFEWGYFEASFQASPKAEVKSFHGKVLRVMGRQPDGSWKFARVSWNPAQ
jgi:uncharacterized protein (TIGR02246 family)